MKMFLKCDKVKYYIFSGGDNFVYKKVIAVYTPNSYYLLDLIVFKF